MKAGAYILVVILSILIIQPLFGNNNSNDDMAESSCCPSKKECSKPASGDSNDDCANNRCNPLMSCPTGNFYLLHFSYISIVSVQIPKLKVVPVNDNRLLTKLTECWHPPEII